MKHNIHTNKAPQAIGTYSQAISTGNLTFISGQIPLNPETMEMVEGDFKIRAHQVFKNIKAIAEAADGNLNNIVKLTIFLTDLENFAAVNEVMAEYFENPYPARAALGVSSLPKGADIEAEAILAHSS
ncbi:MAG TPA: RidA family protein [Woeseiaceae bacterium]|nr:RidA family protein [Woeseiaceae bacterium]